MMIKPNGYSKKKYQSSDGLDVIVVDGQLDTTDRHLLVFDQVLA